MRARVLATACAATLLAACARSKPLLPPSVRWGEDVCSACGMIVSEERFAAAAAVAGQGGRVEMRVYDDIGCLVRDGASAGAGRVLARWVHDHGDLAWLRAEGALYVRSASLQTPMGSGVAGFSSRARAEAFRGQKDGEVLDWTGLTAAGAAGGLGAPPPAAGAAPGD
ncbi:MAG: nitrous oxide reductase accessory protein NosL [bacterium]